MPIKDIRLAMLRSLGSMMVSGRAPSRRALGALAKLYGRRLERRWPFFPSAEGKQLNLEFRDLLELQYARSRNFVVLAIGAFDGVANDPVSEFVRQHSCRAIFVEPQPGPFSRLQDNLRPFKNIELLNAAIDEVSGVREIYYIPPGIDELPAWTEQLASFKRTHLLRHEDRAPGLSKHILTLGIPTLSFDDVLTRFELGSLDVLQIDAEGMDAKMLTWFPFNRLKPSVLHYETVHMSAEEHRLARRRLQSMGYIVRDADSATDDMAIYL